MEFAERIAAVVKRRLPPFILLEDLRSEAWVGLIQAALHYDPTTKVPFEAFARRRIHGAVIDSVRRRNFKHTSTLPLVDHAEFLSTLQTRPFDDLEAELDSDTTSDAVRDAVKRMPERDRKVIELRYFEGMNGKQVSRKLGRPESARSTMHKAALLEFRRSVQASPRFADLKKAA